MSNSIASVPSSAAAGGVTALTTVPPPPAPAPAPFKDSDIVYWFDIALLLILSVFFLAFLPRGIARFISRSDKGKGFILRGGPPTSADSYRIGEKQLNLSRSGTHHSDDERTLHHHTQPPFAAGKQNATYSPPRHVPSWPTISSPVSQFFTKTLVPGISSGHLLILIIYLGGVLFMGFYFSNPVTHPNRWGFIAASQVPWVYVLGTKNNIMGLLLGVGYEKLNVFHRWVGFTVWFTAHVHALSHIWKWVYVGTLAEDIEESTNIWAIVALCCLDLLVFFSIPFFRRRAYNLFLCAHIVGLLLLPIAMSYHKVPIIRYAIVAGIAYVLDHIIRLLKTRITTATIRSVPELSSTYISLPGITHGWRAGQHVRLRVLSSEMGTFGWTEAHPFTIASAPHSQSGSGLVLMCKKAGGWTEKLYNAAKKATYSAESGDRTGKLRVLVEGPYGGLGHMVLSSYSAAIIIVGGSGVSFGLSSVEELLQRVQEGSARTKFIDLVWVVQDQASATAYIQILNQLMLQSESLPGFVLNIKIFYTRMLSPDTEESESYEPMHTAIEVSPGRPRISMKIEFTVERSIALQKPSGVAVAVCGPMGLVEDVKKATGSVDGDRRYKVGGVELHEEAFGY